MFLKVTHHPEAKRELEEAARYYDQQNRSGGGLSQQTAAELLEGEDRRPGLDTA